MPKSQRKAAREGEGGRDRVGYGPVAYVWTEGNGPKSTPWGLVWRPGTQAGGATVFYPSAQWLARLEQRRHLRAKRLMTLSAWDALQAKQEG